MEFDGAAAATVSFSGEKDADATHGRRAAQGYLVIIPHNVDVNHIVSDISFVEFDITL